MSSVSAAAQSVPTSEAQTRPLQSVMRTGQIPAAPEGLEVTIFSERAGAVAALALSPTGEILALDSRSGQIRALRDRDGDGRAETARPLARGFDNPGYFDVFGDRAFVFDASGLWALDLTQISPTPELTIELDTRAGLPFAAVKDAWFIAMPAAYEQPSSLMRVSQSDLSASIDSTIDISAITREACSAESPEACTNFWIASHSAHYGADVVGRIGAAGQLAGGQVSALALPPSSVSVPPTLDGLVITLPEQGVVSIAPFARGGIGPVKPLITGFKSQSGRALWGRPSAAIFDRSGALLIGDTQNGIVWRVAVPAPKIGPRGPRTVDLSQQQETVGNRPSPQMGSAIGRGELGGSSIISGGTVAGPSIIGGAQDPKLRQPDLRAKETFKEALERGETDTDDTQAEGRRSIVNRGEDENGAKDKDE